MTKPITVTFSCDEASEIYQLLQSIIRGNTPDGEDMEGDELVRQCLLANDPELFAERNKAFEDAVKIWGASNGVHMEAEQETYQEAEEEYRYLNLIAGIYGKLHRKGKA
jgi:hypothetical protein